MAVPNNPLVINYIDKLGSVNLYALIYNISGHAFNTTSNLFSAYTDATIDNFDVALTQEANRASLYSTTITNTSGFAASLTERQNYTLEIWNRVGGSPSKTNDFLKGVSYFFWDGTKENDIIIPPSLDGSNYIGQRLLGSGVSFSVQSFDHFGNLANLSAVPHYEMYSQGAILTPRVSGSMIGAGDGLYMATRTLTAGSFAEGRQYDIRISGIISNITVGCIKTFDIVTDRTTPDIRGSLTYVSGYITGSPASSSFVTTFVQSTNDFFNGQILKIASGTLYGQARIISDYDGSTKRIYVNKPFTSTPSSGDAILMVNIGGELNVSA